MVNEVEEMTAIRSRLLRRFDLMRDIIHTDKIDEGASIYLADDRISIPDFRKTLLKKV